MIRTLAAVTALSLPLAAGAATYDIDPSHSAATFKVRHMMVADVKGEFAKMTGTAEYDVKNPASLKVDVKVDPTSINTRDAKRDEHLKSPDFFDVAKFKDMRFVSTKAERKGDVTLLTGNLTIHGVTKPVTFTVTGLSQELKDPWGNVKIGGSAVTKINRKDFGLTWNAALEAGGVLVGDEVEIVVDVELAKKVAAAAAK